MNERERFARMENLRATEVGRSIRRGRFVQPCEHRGMTQFGVLAEDRDRLRESRRLR
jgi:hypothetical protein